MPGIGCIAAHGLMVCKCITLFSHLITIIDNLENLRWSKKWEKEIPLQQKETKILLWIVEWHIQIFRLSAFKIQKIDTCLEIICITNCHNIQTFPVKMHHKIRQINSHDSLETFFFIVWENIIYKCPVDVNILSKQK